MPPYPTIFERWHQWHQRSNLTLDRVLVLYIRLLCSPAVEKAEMLSILSALYSDVNN